jgi:RimJ/RimL family protein N-acetyltransferase
MHLIRRLAPGDLPALEAHLLKLSRGDRRLRFSAPASDAIIRRYCAEIGWDHSILLGGFAAGPLVGAVHVLFLDPVRPEIAELTVSVARKARGRGLGTELVARSLVAARGRGIRELRFVCPADAEAMQRLALKLGARLVTDGELVDGVIDPRCRQPEDAFSWTEEALLPSGTG